TLALRKLLFRVVKPVAKICRTVHRCADAIVAGPRSLQIGISPRCLRRGPCFRRCRRVLDGGSWRWRFLTPPTESHSQNSHAYTNGIFHVAPPSATVYAPGPHRQLIIERLFLDIFCATNYETNCSLHAADIDVVTYRAVRRGAAGLQPAANPGTGPPKA